MKRSLFISLLVAVLAIAFSLPAEAATRRSNSRSSKPAQQQGYCIVARRCASIVIDVNSGTVLSSQDPDKQVYPASLTKLMTAYLLFEALANGRVNLSDRVRVSQHAENQSPLKLGVPAGNTISLEDALESITVKSANDAAVIVAEALAGSEEAFARRMTQKAHELGMNRTTFRNASGLPDPQQLTTARDMALLAKHVLSDFPRYRRYFGLQEAYVAGRTIEGHNRLLQQGRVQGGKTGYIRESGFNLVAWDVRGGRLVIGAVFGGKTAAARDQQMDKILTASANQQAPGPSLSTEVMLTSPPVTPSQSLMPGRKPGSVEEVIAQSEEAKAPEAPPASPALKITQIAPNAFRVSSPTFIDSWAIQVGAYRDIGQAQQALQAATRTAPTVLGSAFPRTLATETTVGALHRAQLIGLNETQAKTACATLTQKGMQCLTMPPGG